MNSSTEKNAFEAVRKASLLCRQLQSSLSDDETFTKDDKSPVTVADYCAQAIISYLLWEQEPTVPLVAEEDFLSLTGEEVEDLLTTIEGYVKEQLPKITREELRNAISRCTKDPAGATKYWVLDPIDGTKGFLRKGQFAISLALIENGEITYGVLGCPNLSETESSRGLVYVAKKGAGATSALLDKADDSRTLSPSQEVTWSEARFCESVESGHSAHGWSSQVSEKLGITNEPVRMDSQCKYAAVATGQAAIYLRLPTKKGYQEKVWDHAAGWLVVTESGGTVTDIHGNPLDFSQGYTLSKNEGVVATRGVNHSRVIEAIEKSAPSRG